MNKETKIKAKFKILCISTNNFTYSDEQIFEESEERWGEYICSYKEFFDPSNNYFIDDYIYVTLEAIIRFENEPKVSINSEIKSSKNLGELMYNQNDDKDFDICFENGKCIKVHKLIISAKSTIFERMIQSFGFKESKESKVLIKDFDYEIVEAAIKYCYGFSIIDSLNISVGIKLLQFSDKYFIDDLKNSMEYYLLNQISPTNVSEISNASIISNSKKLHEKCLDFMYICKNV